MSEAAGGGAARCCPTCRAPFRRPKPWAILADGDVVPMDVRPVHPGDVTICTECGRCAINLPGGGLRAATDEEDAILALHPNVIAIRHAGRAVKRPEQN